MKIFQGLAHHFEHVARELRQLVQKQDAIVSQADFARFGNGSSADQAGIAVSEIDWFVPHQANQRILSAVAERLGLDQHKVISTVADHGNTSAASVPLALAAAIDDGRVKRNDLILIEAIGGGLTWGSALIRM